jgi:hypothetical protein
MKIIIDMEDKLALSALIKQDNDLIILQISRLNDSVIGRIERIISWENVITGGNNYSISGTSDSIEGIVNLSGGISYSIGGIDNSNGGTIDLIGGISDSIGGIVNLSGRTSNSIGVISCSIGITNYLTGGFYDII